LISISSDYTFDSSLLILFQYTEYRKQDTEYRRQKPEGRRQIGEYRIQNKTKLNNNWYKIQNIGNRERNTEYSQEYRFEKTEYIL
jgi:hypothetical protein